MNCRRANVLTYAFLMFSTVPSAQDPAIDAAPPSVIFEALALNRDLATPLFPRYHSPSALAASPDGTLLFVAEQTTKQIAIIDVANGKVRAHVLLPSEPTGMAVARDGKLFVTCSSDLWPAGMVAVIDPQRAKVIRCFSAGNGARSPVISPDGNILYVCDQYDRIIRRIAVNTGTELPCLRGFYQPFSAALTTDGALLIVADCLPAQASTDTAVAAHVYLIDTKTTRKCAEIPLPSGSHSVFDVTVTPDNSYALVTHLTAQFTLRASEIENGWVHTNNVAVIDIRQRSLLDDFALDDSGRGAANPWEVACSSDGKFLCIAHAGSNELSVIDLPGMLKLAMVSTGKLSHERTLTFFGNSHAISGLSQVRQRIPVASFSPRSCCIIGASIFTAGYFGDRSGVEKVERFTLPTGEKPVCSAGCIPLGPKQHLTSQRIGERAFYDGTICREQWQSCGSCHPSARADGLNWILGTNPANTPKNVKSMVYSWWTAPTQWGGKRKDAGESVRLGFINSLFTTTDTVLAACIDTFLMAIKPVPSPYLCKGGLSPAAQRGKAVWQRSPQCDCRSCHSGPLTTDQNLHLTTIPSRWNLTATWDTPTLAETWRDGPWGHVGSYRNIKDILTYDGHSASMNSGLSVEELDDLIEYVLSL